MNIQLKNLLKINKFKLAIPNCTVIKLSQCILNQEELNNFNSAFGISWRKARITTSASSPSKTPLCSKVR